MCALLCSDGHFDRSRCGAVMVTFVFQDDECPTNSFASAHRNNHMAIVYIFSSTIDVLYVHIKLLLILLAPLNPSH